MTDEMWSAWRFRTAAILCSGRGASPEHSMMTCVVSQTWCGPDVLDALSPRWAWAQSGAGAAVVGRAVPPANLQTRDDPFELRPSARPTPSLLDL